MSILCDIESRFEIRNFETSFQSFFFVVLSRGKMIDLILLTYYRLLIVYHSNEQW